MRKKTISRPLALLLGLCLIAGLCAFSADRSRSSSVGILRAQAADLLENITPAENAETLETDERFAAAVQRLGVLLLQKEQENGSGKNLLISPLSVMTALTMTMNGAKGTTLSQMEQVVGGGLSRRELNAYLTGWYRSLDENPSVTLRFANAIWFLDAPDFLVKDSFLQTNADHFNAAIRKTPVFDSAALQEINQWADQHTDHMIPKLLEELDPYTEMVLLNALVFDAGWDDPYNPKTNVRPGIFTLENGEKRDVSMMYSEEALYLEDENCRGIIKYYAGRNYRFAALLPEEGMSMSEFIRSLTAEKLSKLLAGASQTSVVTGLPSFSYDFDTDLRNAFIGLGMTDAFGRADFTDISEGGGISISQIIHRTHIDVDTDGTKAAAVTAVIMTRAMAPPSGGKKEVVFDRPFVYLILDQNNVPVFIGAVTDP